MAKETRPLEIPRRSRVGLVAFMNVPDNRLAYAKWLGDPITRMVLDLTENSIRPVEKAPGESADRYSGLIDGRYETLRLIQALDKIYEAITVTQESAKVEETYGVEGILTRIYGYSPEEAAKIVATNRQTGEMS